LTTSPTARAAVAARVASSGVVVVEGPGCAVAVARLGPGVVVTGVGIVVNACVWRVFKKKWNGEVISLSLGTTFT
jgi:hypothetical protein